MQLRIYLHLSINVGFEIMSERGREKEISKEEREVMRKTKSHAILVLGLTEKRNAESTFNCKLYMCP